MYENQGVRLWGLKVIPWAGSSYLLCNILDLRCRCGRNIWSRHRADTVGWWHQNSTSEPLKKDFCEEISTHRSQINIHATHIYVDLYNEHKHCEHALVMSIHERLATPDSSTEPLWGSLYDPAVSEKESLKLSFHSNLPFSLFFQLLSIRTSGLSFT